MRIFYFALFCLFSILLIDAAGESIEKARENFIEAKR